MRTFCAALALALPLLAIGSEAAKPTPAQLLPGMWKRVLKDPKTLQFTTYLLDGSGTQTTSVGTSAMRRSEIRFRWEVREGVVIHTVVSSNVADAPVGKKLEWKIVALTAKEFVHVDGPGAAKVTETRVTR